MLEQQTRYVRDYRGKILACIVMNRNGDYGVSVFNPNDKCSTKKEGRKIAMKRIGQNNNVLTEHPHRKFKLKVYQMPREYYKNGYLDSSYVAYAYLDNMINEYVYRMRCEFLDRHVTASRKV